jgi:hypothetical protein
MVAKAEEAPGKAIPISTKTFLTEAESTLEAKISNRSMVLVLEVMAQETLKVMGTKDHLLIKRVSTVVGIVQLVELAQLEL